MRIARIDWRRVACAAAMASMAPTLHAQVLFEEDFQTTPHPSEPREASRCSGSDWPGGPGTYPFPSGWFLRNVDNRTPDGQVAYVNDAWEVREDFVTGDSSECVAFSTSFYAPVGAANDWMWTPAVGPLPAGMLRLSWRSRVADPNFADGYEVRVMVAPAMPTGSAGQIGNQLADSTPVFSIAAENAAWTTHNVDLSAYAGQTIHVGFRNNSNDRFLLLVDDIRLERIAEHDPRLLAIAEIDASAYGRLPAGLAYAGRLEAVVRNDGLQLLTDVRVEADLLVDDVVVETLLPPPLPGLPYGASQALVAGTFAYDTPGLWATEARVTAAEGDEDPGDSVLGRELVVVTADELSRAEGAAFATLGLGQGTGGELGNDFDLPVQAALHGVRVGINNSDTQSGPGDGIGDFNGYALTLRVRGWDESGDLPGAELASAVVQVAADAPVGPYMLDFAFDGVVLPPGRYLLSLEEPTVPEPRTLNVFRMRNRFTEGTVWVQWPTLGGWRNVESFGSEFRATFDITAILAPPVLAPEAFDDAFSVPEAGTFTGDVSLNDVRSDNGGNEFALADAPTAGTLAFRPDGTFDYTPAAGSGGSTASFGYTLCDGTDACDAATVMLAIAVNMPVARDDRFRVPPEGTLTGDVSGNDTPSDDGGNTWVLATPPASGTLLMSSSGSFVYTPGPGSAGQTFTFRYSMCDVDADCATAQGTLEVLPLSIFPDGFEDRTKRIIVR